MSSTFLGERVENHFSWPAHLNLRDVGGCTTRSGTVIALRRLYRSAELSHLDHPTACSVREQLGMATIVDLRTSAEVARAGIGPLDNLAGVRHCHMPLFESIEPGWDAPIDQSPYGVAKRYVAMAEAGGPAMVRLLRVLRERESYPVLVHCAAGRDRTGIVIAILLELLDVPRSLIAKDYARSAEAAHIDGGSANAETMVFFLDELALVHGSTGAFLSRHGLTVDEVGALHDALSAKWR